MNLTDRTLGEILRGTVLCKCGQSHPYPQDWDGGQWVCYGCKLYAEMLYEKEEGPPTLPRPVTGARPVKAGDKVYCITESGARTIHTVMSVSPYGFHTDVLNVANSQCRAAYKPNVFFPKWIHLDGSEILPAVEEIPF